MDDKDEEVSVTAEQDGDKFALKKELGLMQGVSVIISSMIGSGIFITPSEVLRLCGSIPVAIIVWAISGLLAICGALMYAELGAMMPKGGGDYEYLLRIFGSPVAFMFSWTRVVLAGPSSLAAGALAFGNYLLLAIFPCEIPETPRYLLAVMALMIFTYLNCRSVKWATRIQVVFASGKVIALVGILIAGIYSFATGGGKYYSDGFSGTSKKPLDIILSFYQAIFAYTGWNYLNYVIEELKEPEKNLPRAIFLGLGTVTALYVLANVAYFAMIPIEQAIVSPALAVTALSALYEPLGTVMSVLVTLSVFGFLNSALFAMTRVGFVAARNGHMPVMMAYVNVDHLTPMVSVVVFALLTLVYISIGDLSMIVNMNSFGETFFYCFTAIAFFYLRWKNRDKPSKQRVNLVFPIVFFVGMFIITILSLIREPVACAGGLAIILGGLIFYFVFCVLIQPASVQIITDKLIVATQKLSNSMFQEG